MRNLAQYRNNIIQARKALRQFIEQKMALRKSSYILAILTSLGAYLIIVAPISGTQARSLDRGGSIQLRLAEIYSATGIHVISGDCMSACTLWLGYSGTCVTADAVLWFHSAIDPLVKLRTNNPWRSVSEASNKALLSAYPPRIRVIVAPWLEEPNFHSMTGLEAAAHGVPLCEKR